MGKQQVSLLPFELILGLTLSLEGLDQQLQSSPATTQDSADPSALAFNLGDASGEWLGESGIAAGDDLDVFAGLAQGQNPSGEAGASLLSRKAILAALNEVLTGTGPATTDEETGTSTQEVDQATPVHLLHGNLKIMNGQAPAEPEWSAQAADPKTLSTTESTEVEPSDDTAPVVHSEAETSEGENQADAMFSEKIKHQPAGMDRLVLAAAQSTAMPLTSIEPHTEAESIPSAPKNLGLETQSPTVKAESVPNTAVSPDPPDQTKVWQMRELSHQLRSALASLNPETNQYNANTAKSTDQPSAVSNARPVSVAASNQIADDFNQSPPPNLTTAASTKTLTPTAASVNAAYTGAKPPETLLASTERSSATQNPVDETNTRIIGTASQTLTEWTAQPIDEASGQTRMPRLIEQIQQVTDWLAEKAEGVIRVGEKNIEANMRLYPPDLGGVRVSVSVQDNGTLQAEFRVEQPETARLIQQSLQQFTDVMSRHGLVVERVQVSVQPMASTSAEMQSGGSDGKQSAEQRREAGFTQDKNRRDGNEGSSHKDRNEQG